MVDVCPSSGWHENVAVCCVDDTTPSTAPHGRPPPAAAVKMKKFMPALEVSVVKNRSASDCRLNVTDMTTPPATLAQLLVSGAGPAEMDTVASMPVCRPACAATHVVSAPTTMATEPMGGG
eukprot:261658-Chlamydomonas_euryale.AAC.1